MDLKVVAVLFCLSVFAISSTQAAIPRCCIATIKNITRHILMMVNRWEFQSSAGSCDIDAVIFHTKNGHICVDPTAFLDLVIRSSKESRMRLWKQKVKKRATQ